MRVKQLIEHLQQLVIRGKAGKHEVFQQQHLVFAWLDYQQLKIFGANIHQQVILINQFFVKLIVFNFSDEFIC